jgi:hypothetical protein
MQLFISQVATGKTNGNAKLFGHSVQHNDVYMCCFGAVGFWLAYWFHCTGEMQNPPDFTNREAWFDIKSLVGLGNFMETKTNGITDKTYTTEVSACLKDLGLPSKKKLHLG